MKTRYISKAHKSCGGTVTSVTFDDRLGYAEHSFLPAPAVFYRNGSLCVQCRECAKPVICRRVFGKVSKKHECNAKCLASRGPVCECSCGGENHGASYGA